MDQAGNGGQNASKALIALGSNATSRHGDPVQTVEAALATFQTLPSARIRLLSRSRLYRTAFVPIGAGADVINAAAVLETDLCAEALLDELHRIEATFDRARDVRWGSRTLDLDLLMMGAQVLPDRATFLQWRNMSGAAQRTRSPDTLILPHPRMADRAFVLVPAVDVAPEWPHPVSGLSVAEMLASLPPADLEAVRLAQ